MNPSVMAERLINAECRINKIEVVVAKHDVKLNIIAFISAATFTVVVSIAMKVLFFGA